MKFRVWDNDHHKYAERVYMRNDGEFFYPNRDSLYPLSIYQDERGPRFKVEAFTGFKASDGTEIYEGDVISVNYMYYHERDESADREVSYEGKVIKDSGIWVIDLNKWNKPALHKFSIEATIKIIKNN